jgi:putative membrane protein
MGYAQGYSTGPAMGGWFLGGCLAFFWLLVLVGIILLVVWAVRASSHHDHTGAKGHTMPPAGTPPVPPAVEQPKAEDEAVAIARKRLASGEISSDEFAEIMRHLGG